MILLVIHKSFHTMRACVHVSMCLFVCVCMRACMCVRGLETEIRKALPLSLENKRGGDEREKEARERE